MLLEGKKYCSKDRHIRGLATVNVRCALETTLAIDIMDIILPQLKKKEKR